jgi:multiple sugar transport system permease protein
LQLERSRRRAAWVFVTPAIVVLAVVNLFPFFYAIWMSLHRMGLAVRAPVRWIGFHNYVQAATDSEVWSSVVASAIFVGGAVMIETVLGTAIALVFNSKLRGMSLFRQVSVLPIMIMPIVSALVWFYMFNPRFGIVNWLLGGLGVPRHEWLTNDWLAMPAIILADVWQWTPFVMLVMFAALQTLPEYVYEAAKIDGLSRFQAFKWVTLPLLRPTLLIIILIRLVDSFKMMELPFIMTKGAGNTEVLPYLVYLNAFVFRNTIGYAATLAIFMIVLITVIARPIARRIGV